MPELTGAEIIELAKIAAGVVILVAFFWASSRHK